MLVYQGVPAECSNCILLLCMGITCKYDQRQHGADIFGSSRVSEFSIWSPMNYGRTIKDEALQIAHIFGDYLFPWNDQFAPTNWWLEDDSFPLGTLCLFSFFSASFRDGKFSWCLLYVNVQTTFLLKIERQNPTQSSTVQSTKIIPYPDTQCRVYWRTFTINLSQM